MLVQRWWTSEQGAVVPHTDGFSVSGDYSEHFVKNNPIKSE